MASKRGIVHRLMYDPDYRSNLSCKKCWISPHIDCETALCETCHDLAFKLAMHGNLTQAATLMMNLSESEEMAVSHLQKVENLLVIGLRSCRCSQPVTNCTILA